LNSVERNIMPFRIGVLKRFVVDHGSFSPEASTARGVYEFE